MVYRIPESYVSFECHIRMQTTHCVRPYRIQRASCCSFDGIINLHQSSGTGVNHSRCTGMQIALKSNFLDVSHCLLYGELPSKTQAQAWHASIMREARLPEAIVNAMEALPTSAHPMSVVMTGVVALGSLHPEQNPAIAGQSIYNSQNIQDAQISRLLGAISTIAAFAYYRSALTSSRELCIWSTMFAFTPSGTVQHNLADSP